MEQVEAPLSPRDIKRAKVVAFAKAVGMTNLVWRTANKRSFAKDDFYVVPRSGTVYSRGLACVHFDSPEMALHDVAHFMVAPKSRKMRANFGLGPANHVDEDRKVKPRIHERNISTEENQSIVLHVLLIKSLFGVNAALDTMKYFGWDYIEFVRDNKNNFWNIISFLVSKGLIDEDGNILFTSHHE